MVSGVFEGHGTMWWQDGSRYTGNFVNNTKSGDGAMFYANGDIYTGQWSNERKEAEGMYMYAVGGEAEAVFEGGKMSGAVSKLTILHSGGMDGYTGEYSEGARTSGAYTHSNGDLYEGMVNQIIIHLLHSKFKGNLRLSATPAVNMFGLVEKLMRGNLRMENQMVRELWSLTRFYKGLVFSPRLKAKDLDLEIHRRV